MESLIFENVNPASKVWFYLANKELSESEIAICEQAIANFTVQWTAHNQALKAGGGILLNRILTLFVDESQANASGCSIDSSVRFIKNLGATLEVDFFYRTGIFYNINNHWQLADLSQLKELIQSGQITPNTEVLDLNFTVLGDFLNSGKTALNKTWLKRYL